MKNINKFYIRKKEIEFRKLEEKKIKLTKGIDEEEKQLKINIENYNKLKSENIFLNNQYVSLKNMITDRGIIIDIENNNYNIKEWDNLLVKKQGGRFMVINRNGEELYSLEKYLCLIIKDLYSEGFNCSLVVIRVTDKLIKVQLRFQQLK